MARTPDTLFTAARRGDAQAVARLLAQQPDLSATDKWGFTALHHACIGDNAGHLDMATLQLLVQAGSPINQRAQEDTGRTPLFLAAEFSLDTAPVQYLLDHGADPTMRCSRGRHMVENAWSDEVRQLLSAASGFAIPAPPPPPKYPDRPITAADWKNVVQVRLKQAFAALRQVGIFAVQGVGYTQQDGLSDCFEKLDRRKDRARYHAYCFYTTQDRSTARASGCLLLAWGITGDASADGSNIIQAGETLVRLLHEQGLDAEWDGSPNSRVCVYLQPLL